MTNESKSKSPKEVLDIMLHNDHFSEWLGIKVLDSGLGYSLLKFTIRKEMLNGFHTVHGGVLFSAADSAFAFACNSHGQINVALECSMTFLRPVFEGNELTVEAKEINRTKKTGLYEITLTNQENKLVAKFKGVSYNTEKEHQFIAE